MTSERLFRLLPFVLVAACHSHVDGTRVDLSAHTHAVDTLTDAEGNVLDVARFEVTLDTVELLACEEPAARVLRELFVLRVARADHPSHGVPTVFDGPITIDLTVEGEQPIGTMNPPPGRYCGAMLVFGAAVVEGTIAETELAHELALGATVFVTFDELELSAEHLEAAAVVHLHAEAAFMDLDLGEATAEMLRASLREGLADMVSVEISESAHLH
jgi:hypothetical protein